VVAQMRLVGARKRLNDRSFAAIGHEQVDAVVHMRRIALCAAVDMDDGVDAAFDLELQCLGRERHVETHEQVVALTQGATGDSGRAKSLRLASVDVRDAVGHRNAVRARYPKRRLARGLLRLRDLGHRSQQHFEVGIVIALDLARRQPDDAQPFGRSRGADGTQLLDQLGLSWSNADRGMNAHAAAPSNPA
jgi:hypothetical protein